jgi:hypothetical protein
VKFSTLPRHRQRMISCDIEGKTRPIGIGRIHGPRGYYEPRLFWVMMGKLCKYNE